MFGDSPQTAFFRVIEASMAERPGEWKVGGYRITNPSMRTSIWIANATYGIHVEVDDARLDPNWRWRRRLRRAADRCIAAQAVSRLKSTIGQYARVGDGA